MKKFHRKESADGTVVTTLIRTPSTLDEARSYRVLVMTFRDGKCVDKSARNFATSATLFEKFPQLRDEE